MAFERRKENPMRKPSVRRLEIFAAVGLAAAVFTIDASGTGQRQVTHPPKGVVDDQPDWAPDGSRVAFSRCPKKPEGPCAIYTVHPDCSGLTRVSKPCPPSGRIPPCTDDYVASFSPDGKELVFKQFSGQKNGRGQNIVSADGTHSRRVTPWSLHAGDNPDWSPDGKWILFRSYEDVDNKQSQIYLIHPDGSGLKQLTHFKKGAIVTSSSFSPDGKRIVFATTGLGGNADLFVMRPDGSGMHPITRTKLWDSAPDWGPRP